jgi:membrane protease YdiL (CAAX protease family)
VNIENDHQIQRQKAGPRWAWAGSVTAANLVSVLTLLLLLTASQLMRPLGIGWTTWLTQIFVVAGVPLLYIWITRLPLRSSLNLGKPRPIALLLAAFVGTTSSVIMWGPSLIVEYFANALLGPFSFDLGSTWAVPIAALIAAPLFEELHFRGFLTRAYQRQRYPPWFTMVVVGLIFGLFHGSLTRSFLLGLFGVLAGYMVMRTGTFWTGVAYHFGVNLLPAIVQMVLLILGETLPSDLSELAFNETMVFGILAVGGMLVLAGLAITAPFFLLFLYTTKDDQGTGQPAALANTGRPSFVPALLSAIPILVVWGGMAVLEAFVRLSASNP